MPLPPPVPSSTCLVTGASSGIGADIARELARRGHGLTLVARREERLQDLADELERQNGVRVETIAADVAEESGRRRLIKEVDGLELTVDVLVNNAGFGSGGRFQDLDGEREVEMVRTNVEAVVALSGTYVPRMVRARRGAVLNVASTAAFQPLPGQATYAATKAFVLSFTEALASDLGGTGVVATALCPGVTKTEFFDAAEIGVGSEKVFEAIAMSSRSVAETGVDGLDSGKRVVVPGVANRIGAVAGQHVPRALFLPVARRLNPAGK